ncbi:YolD-like family protein [Ectobacillus polymachus]|uniref:YolD-like family protein n=1 Tax=Ectobacillus polymachus TaxID=1508806 RepID=UPI003A8B481D
MKCNQEAWNGEVFHYESGGNLERSVTPETNISFEIMICEAMEHNQYVSFDYRHHGVISHLTGRVHHYNERQQCLHIIDTAGKARYIFTEAVVHLEICKEW